VGSFACMRAVLSSYQPLPWQTVVIQAQITWYSILNPGLPGAQKAVGEIGCTRS